jgi:hypothetical protein
LILTNWKVFNIFVLCYALWAKQDAAKTPQPVSKC